MSPPRRTALKFRRIDEPSRLGQRLLDPDHGDALEGEAQRKVSLPTAFLASASRVGNGRRPGEEGDLDAGDVEEGPAVNHVGAEETKIRGEPVRDVSGALRERSAPVRRGFVALSAERRERRPHG